jgi:very-short-patch-repair endonuclease
VEQQMPGPDDIQNAVLPTEGSPISVEIDAGRVVNYAMQQNGVPLVRSIRISNTGSETVRDPSVMVTTTGKASRPLELRIASLEPGGSHRLSPIDLEWDANSLANQLERELAELRVDVLSGQTLVGRFRQPLEVLAFNQWTGSGALPELLAAFCTPNHPAIDGLLGKARDALGQATGDPSLSGYQGGRAERVRAMVQAIASALRGAEVGYVNPPASYEQAGQKIRSADQVLGDRLGTCLDLTMTFAAALEQSGLNPVLVLCKGHAFVGVWTHDESFPEPTIEDRARLLKRVQIGEIIVLETTALVAGAKLGFRAVEEAAERRLAQQGDFVLAVDVRAARRTRILPLPSRVATAEGFSITVDPAQEPEAPGNPIQIDRCDPSTRPTNAAPSEDATVASGLSPEAHARLDKWKRRLLDLTLRNRLLNFRETKKAIPLLVPDVGAFEDALAADRTFSVRSRPEVLQNADRDLGAEARRTGTDAPAAVLNEHLAAGRVCANLAQTDLDTRLVELFRSARTSEEETGSSSLYLAIGTLVWYETAGSTRGMVAPIVLVPATLKREGDGQTYRLGLSDEDARINVTLLEMLRNRFRLDGSGLNVLAEDESGFDIPGTLKGFTALVKEMPRWEVRHTAHLSQFSFAKFVMWSDLEMRTAAIAKSPVVKRLLERESVPRDSEPLEPSTSLDNARGEEAGLCAVDADSSQVAAIRAAMRGRTFVLQGPPGTGKSQTITNVLANAIAAGRRVLFVAEKMAALSVVKSRMEKLGLGRFCLELHSTKSGKREVLAQLNDALSASPQSEPDGWHDEIAAMESVRDSLNTYAETLHQIRPSGESVHAAMGRLCQVAGSPKIDLPLKSAGDVTAEQLRSLRSAVDSLVTAADAVGGPGASPLRGVGLKDWTIESTDELVESARAAESVVAEVLKSLERPLRALGLTGADSVGSAALSWAEIEWLGGLSTLLSARQSPTRDLMADPQWETLRPQLTAAIERGRRRDQLRNDLGKRWTPAFLTADHAPLRTRAQAAESAGGLVRWWRRRGVRALLAPHHNGPIPRGALPIADLIAAEEIKLISAALGDPHQAPARLLGSSWAGGEGNWDQLASLVEWAGQVRSLLDHPPTPCGLPSDRIERALKLATSGGASADSAGSWSVIASLLKQYHAALERLGAATAWQRPLIARDDEPGFLSKLQGALQRWRSSADHLAEWCAWRRLASSDAVPELIPFIQALERGTLTHDSAKPAFERAYASKWLKAIWDSEPSLRGFAHAEQTRRVREFRERDGGIIRLSRQVVAARAGKSVPPPSSAGASPDSEVGLLRRQLALKTRHMPVRRLVQKLPHLLPRLKPCWLMSPLSVAQYLDPALPPFDLIVFDEASQIPAWDAVGALARGTDAVIVGDSKQLPPTSFFAKSDDGEADDEADFEELESILDESVASGLPALDLRWHYRSRHESLIAFSNRHYYRNRLLTFPSPQERMTGLGVSLKYLPNGCYDRGRSKTNKLEAAAVCDEVVRRLRAAGNGHASLGVVTFSMAQQHLVEDLLDHECAKHPELGRFFSAESPEPVFIKNLENVQGDERDAILFSICYGPDETGRVSVVMGPLNRDGGERRLNVAITRARREVLVFTSVRPDQIDLSRTRATGVAHLREFLDYAERGPKALTEAAGPTGEDCDSPFEEAVRDALVGLGYRVDCQVGCSGYRIDLAVRHPEQVGRYVLGIECDGATYHSAASARDRDRLREHVLRDLGWDIHRVWSTDWFQSRSRALDRIKDAIRTAIGKGGQTTIFPTKAEEEASASTESQPVYAAAVAETPAAAPTDAGALAGSQPYRRHLLSGDGRTSEGLYSIWSAERVMADIDAIVQTEAPVRRELLQYRVAEAWGVGRVTTRCRERIDHILSQMHQTGRVRLLNDVVWTVSLDPETYAGFRVPSEEDPDARPFEHVTVQELANAASAILAAAISLPRSTLRREVCRVFGVQRATPRLEMIAEAGIRELAEREACVIEGDQVRVT